MADEGDDWGDALAEAKGGDDDWGDALAEQESAGDGGDDWGDALAEQDTSSGADGADDWGDALAEQDTAGGDDWGDALAEQDSSGGDDWSELEDSDSGGAAPDGGVPYVKANFQELEEEASGDIELDVLLDVPITISMEIGRTRISIRNLLQLNQGSVVELDRLAGEPMDVLVNGTLIAHGEVVVVNEKFGIRLTDVISPAERVRKLK